MQAAARSQGSRAAQALWEAYVQQRRGAMGLTLPSSKSLWDVVNRGRLEPHGAESVRDIWMQVGMQLGMQPTCQSQSRLIIARGDAPSFGRLGTVNRQHGAPAHRALWGQVLAPPRHPCCTCVPCVVLPPMVRAGCP